MNYHKTISAFNQKETMIMKTDYLIFSLWLKHSFETPLRNFKLSLNPTQERSRVSFRQCNKYKKEGYIIFKWVYSHLYVSIINSILKCQTSIVFSQQSQLLGGAVLLLLIDTPHWLFYGVVVDPC